MKRNISLVAKFTTIPLIIFGYLPILGYVLGGGVWHWVTIMVLVLMIILDPIVGTDSVNTTPELDAKLENSFRHRLMLWLTVPTSFITTLFGYSLITNTPLSMFEVLGVTYSPLSIPEQIGLTCSMVVAVGFGIVVAHELCHHGNKIDRFLGQLQCTPIGMVDFFIYHNFGHHITVATPEDLGSAPYGISFWAFASRSIPGKTKAAWKIEKERLHRNGYSPWTLRNRFLTIALLPILWFSFLFYLFGPISIILFALQYAFPRMILATADYAEHYGLARKQLADGTYEKIRPEHAWDDTFILSGLFFCQIVRHSDHHTFVGRPYQILRTMSQSPKLPLGYLVILWASMVPPIWRKLVHPVIEKYYEEHDVLPYALPYALPERFREKAVITTFT